MQDIDVDKSMRVVTKKLQLTILLSPAVLLLAPCRSRTELSWILQVCREWEFIKEVVFMFSKKPPFGKREQIIINRKVEDNKHLLSPSENNKLWAGRSDTNCLAWS